MSHATQNGKRLEKYVDTTVALWQNILMYLISYTFNSSYSQDGIKNPRFFKNI